ncbi:C39 family peptidase [Ectobacillus sp. JY-23]|uniref:C39 family peptidase n=1 Tax=Ectobacillus sp. JY-23 TaxID=2933872 RepID=UPI001FF480D2|nr:C39 family peptidase [Ectobacillus sp. JY-23]UOY94598.1 C39 family peptidase [Ectobacillus sp. JY-23]
MKKTVLSAVLASAILGSSFAPHVHANVTKQGIMNVQKISPQKAKQAAENFIASKSHLAALKNAKLSLKEYLYDTDDNVIGYYFEATSAQTTGYFITSALTHLDPIIQYGIDGNLSELLHQKGSQKKTYYFGAMKFQFGNSGKEVQANFQKAKQASLGKMAKSNTVATAEVKKLETLELTNIQKRTSPSPGWKALATTANQMQALAATYKVLPVDRIYQRASGIKNPNSACGATTAAMIMDYYYDVLGYNVRDNKYYGSWASLVNHLYNEMGSTWIGTSLSMWANGALTHVYHTSPNWSTKQYSDAVGKSANFIAAIDSKDPVALRFDRFDAGGSDIEYHFVAGIGYDKNGSYTGDLHVAYKDPDNGKDNTGTHWLDWTADDDDFGFAYLVNK